MRGQWAPQYFREVYAYEAFTSYAPQDSTKTELKTISLPFRAKVAGITGQQHVSLEQHTKMLWYCCQWKKASLTPTV